MTNKTLQATLDWGSRKYRTAWMLTTLLTTLLALPAVASLVLTLLGYNFEFSILPASYYCTLISIIWTAYFGANIAEKHQSFVEKASVVGSQLVRDVGEGLGGQPEGTDNP